MQVLSARVPIRRRLIDLSIGGGIVALVLSVESLRPAAAILPALLIHPLLSLARAWSRPGAVLRVDHAGIHRRDRKPSTIPWDQVADARLYGGRMFVGLRDPEALGVFDTPLARMQRPFGGSGRIGVWLELRQLDRGPTELAEGIREWIAVCAPATGLPPLAAAPERT